MSDNRNKLCNLYHNNLDYSAHHTGYNNNVLCSCRLPVKSQILQHVFWESGLPSLEDSVGPSLLPETSDSLRSSFPPSLSSDPPAGGKSSGYLSVSQSIKSPTVMISSHLLSSTESVPLNTVDLPSASAIMCVLSCFYQRENIENFKLRSDNLCNPNPP